MLLTGNQEEDEHDAGQRRQEAQSLSVDISSVITSVTTREAVPYQPLQQPRGQGVVAEPEHVRRTNISWRSKWRSLLCCFAPPSHGYFKSFDGDHFAPRFGLQHPKAQKTVIGPKRIEDTGKKTLVLDLDETLVHSSFKPIPNPDYILPVEIDGKMVDVYVLKRPWLDHFMESVGPRFETIVFTASLAKYADPLLDLLDKKNLTRWRLFREACFPYEGNYVKDLTCLGRDLSQTIIVDNSPHSYVFQPANAIPIGTFIDNMEDQELLEMLPLLNEVEHVPDVRVFLGAHLRHGDTRH